MLCHPYPDHTNRDVMFASALLQRMPVWYTKKREQSVKQKILPELVHSKQHRNMQLRKTLALWYLGGRSTLGLTNYYPLKRTSPLRGRKPEKVTLCFNEHHHHHQQVLSRGFLLFEANHALCGLSIVSPFLSQGM